MYTPKNRTLPDQLDTDVNLTELEEGLHEVAAGGGIDGLRYFDEMIKSQEMKLQAQYEALKWQAQRNATTLSPELDEKVQR